ncbi:hypothetical protein QR680_011384 [Steinernema hermaphroditum]|uniref:ZP domain-containing protein n=1 Tax=Steinernema hermaphroditum TaxID=289476 RepID=A0AA39IS38_9BILA|nr:hypothetical protein QR680_011384 [Steinernema hermaphroditum]
MAGFSYSLLRALILLYSSLGFSYGFIENSVIGVPKVMCEENDVALDVITSKPFEGNIFVKGRAKDSSCRQSYTSNGTNVYSLPLGKCGMQRLRSANPRGVNFAVTVIVSFHPAGFITKQDRAFHVTCFYLEPEEVVTQSLEVSALATTELRDEMHMPTCEYTVRRNSIDGPVLTYSSVGETVFHVWECRGPDVGMLVKKCFVTDGDGEDHAVVDADGCAIDHYLLGDIKYDSSLMRAHAQSQVFKYADSNQLYFTCQIRLCQKQMGTCDNVTPPICGADKPARERRHTIEDPYLSREFDVATAEMLVLDRDEGSKVQKNSLCISRIFLPLIPLAAFTLISVTASVTLIFQKNCCTPKKLKDTDDYLP